MRRQVNAGESLGIIRGAGNTRADQEILRAERVLHELPDRVSRNLLKQLLRRSLTRIRKLYQSTWATHSASSPSMSQPSLRKVVPTVIQSNGDTRGLKVRTRTGLRYKRKPRSYIAPIVDARPGWGIRRQIQAQISPASFTDDLALVIEREFDHLVTRARLKLRRK